MKRDQMPKSIPEQGTINEKYLECPMCNSFFTKTWFFPESVRATVVYSDGQSDISDITNPAPITHCIYCAYFFSIEEATHESNTRKGRAPEYFASKPSSLLGNEITLHDYLIVLKRKSISRGDQKFLVRKHLWWLFNNELSANKSLTQWQHEIHMENMTAMLSLIAKYRLEEPLIQSEIYRNMGMYDLCLETIWNLPSRQHSSFIKQLSIECANKNPHRIEIK